MPVRAAGFRVKRVGECGCMEKTEEHRVLRAIDFHTHLLPAMDDGSISPVESRAMLDSMRAQGIVKVVLTPHFYPDRESPDEFLVRRERSASELIGVLLPTDPSMYLGAEVAYYEGIGASSELGKLCIDGTSCILIELPFEKTFCLTVYRDLEMIVNRGFRTVIAHMERYPACRSKAVRQRLRDIGVLMQSNAEGFIAKATAGRLHKLWRRGEIHLLGSDCHHEACRAPNLGTAIDVLCRAGQTEQLVRSFEKASRLLDDAIALGGI